ncbi:LamG domain-containing protein [Streptomyces violascens]|uniref:LamG domain-containing protein n=1 Tax=Streptomyces violascens TaxID=67381 RepID=UPI003663B0FA
MGGISAYSRAIRRRRPRQRSAAGLITAALAAAVVGLPTPAVADNAPEPTGGDAQHVQQLPPDERATLTAKAQAAASGHPVVIDTLTTPYAQTVANSDGTLTETSTAVPTRAKTSGSWASVDATLQAQADDTLTPRTAVNRLTLSGGGSGPLATLTSPAGKRLAVTMPFTLPKPATDGDTATYANVLPDIDLAVTATELGGIREVLVVKTAAAAANPALTTLHLATSGPGLTLNSDARGALEAVDAATGAPQFTAPAPQMWDSSTAGSSAASAKSAKSAAMSAKGLAVAQDSPADASTADGPGPGARSATMATAVSSGSVDITPVADILHGSTTHYPVYIDPSYIPWSPGDPAWTWVQSAHTGSSNYGVFGSSHSQQPGVGVCGTYPGGGSCSPADKERTYYQFNIAALGDNNDVIGSAELHVTQTYSADWSCTNKYGIRLYYSKDTIGSGTDWNSHPSDTSTGLTDEVGGTGSSGCGGDVAFAYNVKSQVQGAADGNWKTITFGLYGDEGDANGLKRLSNKASLAVTYDHTPNVPTGMTSSPVPGYASTGTTQPCEATTNPTDKAFVGTPGLTSGLQLKATVSSPTSPRQPVRGYFSTWDDSVSGTPDTAHGDGYSNGGGYVSSGSQVSFTVPKADFTDGHAYAWNVKASDGILASAGTTPCHFRVDLTAPTVTTPSAPDYQVGNLNTVFPPAGNGQTANIYAGKGGWVPFTATDPAPAVGLPSQLACMRWGFDPTLTTAAWQCGSALPKDFLAAFPQHWGTNILYIQAQDNAGNLSQLATYAFYVPWNPNGPAPVFGDTTGDGSADIVTPGDDGNLYAHTVPGNTQATSPATALAARVANTPDGDSWGDYRTTHRGSLRGGLNVDDLIVHKDGAAQLYFYYNPGNTGTDGRFDKRAALTKPACKDDGSGSYCAGYAADWSTTTRIAALGDVSTTTLDSGTFRDRTGLLTEEATASGDAALWFYLTVSDGQLGAPVRLAASGWKDLEPIAPGDWNHSGHPGLWARNHTTGDITAYTFTTGTTPVPGSTTTPPETVPTLTGIAAGPKLGNLSATDNPVIGSDGDLTGDGIADLWCVTKGGVVNTWAGHTPDGTSGTAVDYFLSPINSGTTAGAADQWRLNGNGADQAGLNAATAVGTVGWAADHTGTAPGAATFTGSSYLKTAAHALNTSKSYTVSAWVKLDSLAATQVAVSQGTATHQAFYLGYNGPKKSWQFMTTTTEAATTTYPVAFGGPAPAAGIWTHLTGVYDADTEVMSLYVNGALTGTADRNATPVYNASGPLTVGANITVGSTSPYDPLTGAVSDVRTFPSALTAAQVKAVYANS